VLPELEYAISSTMFSGPFRGSMSKLALSLVYRQHHLSRYLDYHVVVVDRMNYLVTKFKEALKKVENTSVFFKQLSSNAPAESSYVQTPDRALNIFTDQAFYFAAGLEPLWRASLPAPPLFENSFVYSGGFSGEFLAKYCWLLVCFLSPKLEWLINLSVGQLLVCCKPVPLSFWVRIRTWSTLYALLLLFREASH
jgi:hypothetical protein